MSRVTFTLHDDELVKIIEFMKEYPATMVTLVRDTGSGIGYILEAIVDQGDVKIVKEITGVDSW